jgi:hypothetical protein
MNAKLTERLAFSAPAEWVSMAEYRKVLAAASADAASPPVQVSVQLRKATDASGTNAANLGSAVTSGDVAVAEADVSDLGATVGGVLYTHVSATITNGNGVVIRGSGRFSP